MVVSTNTILGIPAIPDAVTDDASLKAQLDAMKEAIEVLTGARGDPNSRALTWGEATENGKTDLFITNRVVETAIAAPISTRLSGDVDGIGLWDGNGRVVVPTNITLPNIVLISGGAADTTFVGAAAGPYGIEGAPEGGNTGQVLIKLSGADGDWNWGDQVGGGGASLEIQADAVSLTTGATLINFQGFPSVTEPVGDEILVSLYGADNNMFFGAGAGGAITTGIDNAAFGKGAATGVTSGVSNYFFGDGAGTNITVGDGNYCIGPGAGPTTDDSYGLYIGSGPDDTPLIYGNLLGNDLQLNNLSSITTVSNLTMEVSGHLILESTDGYIVVRDSNVSVISDSDARVEFWSHVKDAELGFITNSANMSLYNHKGQIIIQAGTASEYDIVFESNVVFNGGGGTEITKSGTPVNNQIALWTSSSNLEGDAELTYDGNHLRVNGGNITLRNTATYLNIIDSNASSANSSNTRVRFGWGGSDTIQAQIYTNSGELRIDNTAKIIRLMPGSGSGDDTVVLVGNLDVSKDLVFTEQAAVSNTPAATFGIVWTRNDAPNNLIFTDDAGTPFVLNSDGRTSTTTNLADIAHAVNTGAQKVAGHCVFNTTTGAPVWAVSNADGGAWNDATGATAHTPA